MEPLVVAPRAYSISELSTVCTLVGVGVGVGVGDGVGEGVGVGAVAIGVGDALSPPQADRVTSIGSARPAHRKTGLINLASYSSGCDDRVTTEI